MRQAESLSIPVESFSFIFDNVPIAIIITSGTSILYANPSYLNLFGFASLAELATVEPLALFAPEHRPQILENIQRHAIGLTAPDFYEAENIRKDGTCFPTLMYLARVMLTGFPATVAFIVDISRRKQVEEQMALKDQQLAVLNQLGQALNKLAPLPEILERISNLIGQVFSNLNLYIALYDESTNFVSFPIYWMDGTRKDSLDERPLGNGLTEFVIHARAPVLIPDHVEETLIERGITVLGTISQCYLGVPIMIDQRVLGVIAVQDYEHANVYTAEHVELFSIIASQAAIAIENARLFEQARQEIAERKRAEQEIQAYTEHLEDMVEDHTRDLRLAQGQVLRNEKIAVLAEVAGRVGHELRNPLGVISGAAYYLNLAQPHAEQKIKHYHDLIKQETLQAENIIADLLDFARLSALAPAPLSVPELVQGVRKRFPVPASVQLLLNLPAGLPLIVADPRHMDKLLDNLVINAIQAMESGGTLTISAQPSALEYGQPAVCIRVQDTGTGIRSENLNKIFDPLFTTKTSGIGLGLAVCRKLAEANRGRIEVESEVGKGSTFNLVLPAYVPAKLPAQAELT
jgi:PAS domain S-box-containing protein